MGYKRKRGLDLQFPPEFTDSSGEKLEVCIANGTMEEYFTVKELLYKDITDAESVRKDMAELYDIFEPKLQSWNLEEDDGTPIPFTRATFAAEDRALVTAIMRSWLDAVSGVPRPLERPSPAGAPSVVASIPVETLPPTAQAS